MAGFGRQVLLAVVLALAVVPPVGAEIRVSDLDVFLNDFEVTVNAVVVGTVPATFQESIHSGIPAYVRFTVELWQYSRFWRDRLIVARALERHLTYNVVTKEYKVTFLKGETRPVYATRDLRDAQRLLSEVRGAKLAAAASLDPTAVIYVRVLAETSLNGENTFVARLAGTAEQTMRQSEYRTLTRIQ